MVSNHDAFYLDYDLLPEAVQDELLAMTGLMEVYGPQLGRSAARTLTHWRVQSTKI